MNGKITPCERLGYKVGDKFKASKSGAWFNVGEEVELGMDDGSNYPYFFNARMPKDSDGGRPLHIESVEKISNAKLKPAKQALADAIHQNGGWRGGKYAVYGKHSGKCSFLTCKPQYLPKDHGWFVMLSWIAGEFDMKPFVNWHQCILSREEYFTAYPEQVKVEICNETKRKVEVEMESESEMTIGVGDWHERGELPPVGAFVDVVGDSLIYGQGESNCEVIAHVENTAVIRMSYGLGCFESGAIIPASTERDKAIDEMVCEFIDHHGDPKGGERYLGIAAKLYDAGYRKEVK